MARKAIWMVILLGALLALSVSAVFAANVTRPAQAALTPETQVSSVGQQTGAAKGIGSYHYGRGDCPYSQSDSASAY